MTIITRKQAVKNLKRYIGQDLAELAKLHGITSFETGRQNKGWKGLVLERLAGLRASSSKAPNGLLYEIKSVSFYYVRGKLVPKETMAITMINPEELKAQPFFKSHCWNKLKSLIFCAVTWHGKNNPKAELIQVTSLDFATSDDLIREVETDYEFIRSKLIKQGFESLTGQDGKWIQARTKGSGHGSISRAFYARKSLVSRIFELSS
ncbi:MAG: MutH/Sau3AI family endonuclease [Dehalococcoidales bacterium]